MKIRKGSVSESEAFERVLKQATLRIKATGSSQWAPILAGQESKIIVSRLAQGEAFFYETVVENRTQIVAAFYLYQSPNDWDSGIWQDEEEAGVYYLHRLSLADGFTGKGLAAQLLSQLQTELSARGGKAIRLDCIATQPVLNKLYSRSGFELVKVVPNLQAGPILADFNLYECRL